MRRHCCCCSCPAKSVQVALDGPSGQRPVALGHVVDRQVRQVEASGRCRAAANSLTLTISHTDSTSKCSVIPRISGRKSSVNSETTQLQQRGGERRVEQRRILGVGEAAHRVRDRGDRLAPHQLGVEVRVVVPPSRSGRRSRRPRSCVSRSVTSGIGGTASMLRSHSPSVRLIGPYCRIAFDDVLEGAEGAVRVGRVVSLDLVGEELVDAAQPGGERRLVIVEVVQLAVEARVMVNLVPGVGEEPLGQLPRDRPEMRVFVEVEHDVEVVAIPQPEVAGALGLGPAPGRRRPPAARRNPAWSSGRPCRVAAAASGHC